MFTSGTEESWPYLLGFYVILVIFGAFAFPFIPESPKYLFVVKKQQAEALKRKKLKKFKLQNSYYACSCRIGKITEYGSRKFRT